MSEIDDMFRSELNIKDSPVPPIFAVILGRLFKIHPIFIHTITQLILTTPSYVYIIFIAEDLTLWNEYILVKFKSCIRELITSILLTYNITDNSDTYTADSNNNTTSSVYTDYPYLYELITTYKSTHMYSDHHHHQQQHEQQEQQYEHEQLIDTLVELYLIRIKFIHYYKYVSILQCSYTHVILDTFPYGGCLTSHDSLSNYIPMVTLPLQYVRGRYTYMMYTQMSHTNLIADNTTHYIQLTQQLLLNNTYYNIERNSIKQAYTQRYHKNELVAYDWLRFIGRLVSQYDGSY